MKFSWSPCGDPLEVWGLLPGHQVQAWEQLQGHQAREARREVWVPGKPPAHRVVLAWPGRQVRRGPEVSASPVELISSSPFSRREVLEQRREVLVHREESNLAVLAHLGGAGHLAVWEWEQPEHLVAWEVLGVMALLQTS